MEDAEKEHPAAGTMLDATSITCHYLFVFTVSCDTEGPP